MPIQPLSDSDIRAIGSSLVLNDARSVIKELIDNALDAHANTISIEISLNTVDVIQVRDNGSGIGCEDRSLLCKRGCTSKIRTIQDLENLGGSSLGFRGEALASVVGLSNAVVVTTRIDGELVGSSFRFGHDGQLPSSSSASHPVGTTIRVHDFLKTIPVRRQTALKAASRTLSEIKQILQAYAFARPNVRISFKVLKAKSGKFNWTYGPSPGTTTLLNAAAKIVGQEVAANSEARLWTLRAEEEAGKSHIIDAVVAKGEGDPIKIGNNGHFISIDGRPISTARGVFKDFVKLYKAYYRHWMSANRSIDSSVDPFLCLHLRCPAGSYDVNIEPAKDEVLFMDVRNVRNVLEDFLRSVYGDLPEKSETSASRDHKVISRTSPSQPFELLLARRGHHLNERPNNTPWLDQGPSVMDSADGNERKEAMLQSLASAEDEPRGPCRTGDNETVVESSLDTGSRPHRNMYDFDEDDLATVEPPLSPEQTSTAGVDDAEIRKSSVTNPWSIAKLNALIPSAASLSSKGCSGSSNDQLATPGPDPRMTGLVSKTDRTSFLLTANLPSPARSDSSRSPARYQRPSPLLGRGSSAHQVDEDDIESTQELANGASARSRLTPLVQPAKPKPLESQLPSSARALKMRDIDGSLGIHSTQRNDNSEDRQTDMQSTQLIDSEQEADLLSPSRKSVRKPFIPHYKPPERPLGLHSPLKLTPTPSPPSWARSPIRQPWGLGENILQNTSPASHAHTPPLSQSHQHPMASPPRLQPSPTQSFRKVSQMVHQDLDEIMDFEHRKKAANAQRKTQSKLTNRYLDPGQLAQIQRESTTSSQAIERGRFASTPFRKHLAPSLNARDELKSSCIPARPVGQIHSGPSPPWSQHSPISPPQKQSPHPNRNLAAKAALTRPRPLRPSSPAHRPAEHESDLEDIDTAEILPPLSEDDPRAYLIQHRDASSSNTNVEGHNIQPELAIRTSLKIKRAKTSKLPFETIPLESATYNISAKPLTRFPPFDALTAQINALSRLDTYCGTGVNRFSVWDANSVDVLAWESKLVALIREKYVAKLHVGGGVEVPANPPVRLTTALRAHCADST